MRYLIVASAIFIIVNGAPLQNDSEAKILQYKYEKDDKGNYNFSFLTSNGIKREEVGTVVDEGLPIQRIMVRGTFSFITPEGIEESWMYTANENGYHQEPFIKNVERGEAFSPAVVASLLGK